MINAKKKSFTYIEAIKAILCYLGVIIMIGSEYVLIRGPTISRIDNNCQGDLNSTRHYTHAAPQILNIHNCRKYNTFIVTTFNVQDQNKIHFNDTKAHQNTNSDDVG